MSLYPVDKTEVQIPVFILFIIFNECLDLNIQSQVIGVHAKLPTMNHPSRVT